MYTTENMTSCMQRSPSTLGGMGTLTGAAGHLTEGGGMPMSCTLVAMAGCKEYHPNPHQQQQHPHPAFTNNNDYQHHHHRHHHSTAVHDVEFDESFDEEVDEEFSDEEMMDVEDDVACQAAPSSDVTSQLLQFADMVNGDIQKYFGTKKGDEESCNIYEDKWKHSRSGRELYYADLMKIAQGIDTDADDRVTSTTSDANSPPPSGKMDKKVGLGPLKELFEYGLRDFKNDKKIAPMLKKLKKVKSDDLSKIEVQVPLNKRQFPDSFWSEPRDQHNQVSAAGSKDSQSGGSSSTCLTSSKTPDFSDLLESWTGDDHGDMSSSDLATPSPSTAVQPVPPAH